MAPFDSVCEILPWDSAHFGLRIGRVCAGPLSVALIRQIDAWQRQHEIECLYMLLSIQDVQSVALAESSGFHLVDLRVTLSRRMTGPGTPSAGIRVFRPDDLPQLKRLAGILHRDSRFFSDTRFPEAQARKMFEIWIEKACADPEQHVFIADRTGVVDGYVACQPTAERSGRIQLIGVDPAVRRQGVGASLIAAAVNWFASKGVAQVDVVTQARNMAALRLYERGGFQISAIELWYHRWTTRPANA